MNQQHEGSPVAVLKSTPPSGRGWLRNGNVPGDFHNCERCGAKTRAGPPCLSPAMKNGRCRMHDGKSTGPRTEAGLERDLRDSVGGVIFSGTNDIQRNIIAQHLRLG